MAEQAPEVVIEVIRALLARWILGAKDARATGSGSPPGCRAPGEHAQGLHLVFTQRDVHLDTLRHAAASFLPAAGTHTKVVQEHLGHSSYAITADIHSHVGPAQQREAADRLDQALRW